MMSNKYKSYNSVDSIEEHIHVENNIDKKNNYSSSYYQIFLLILGLIVFASIAQYTMKYNGKKLNSVNHNSFSIQTAKPNIVFILADDLGYSSIGYEEFDLSFVSPFLTSMAKNGILMTNYYGQEICTPSRAALLTGRYPLTVGLQTGELQPVSTHGLNLTEILLPEVLRNLGGYKNYALGKWNLGHFSAQYLPTARGFDYFLGYMAGQVYYWSKHIPHYSTYKDFLFCDKNCYFGYGKDDSTTYSTFLYRDKSISLINQHDFDKNPMFLYLPFQAVHDPFDEYDGNYSTGVPRQYFEDTAVYDLIVANISGKNRQQYAMSLSLLDHAVHKIYDTLDALGQVDNTYFVFASDNGGCYEAGGRNGELRGSKGTYFEGGIKVDSFLFSSLLPEQSKGTVYSGIMHVSDWFPTILTLAGIDYVPQPSAKLDGVDQFKAMIGQEKNQRSLILNGMSYYTQDLDFNLSSDAVFAIRDTQFKLMHAYAGTSSKHYPIGSVLSSDDDLESFSCSVSTDGDYTRFLFDLQNDPNEFVNLYNDTRFESVKNKLYEELKQFQKQARFEYSLSFGTVCYDVWQNNSNYVLPWILDPSDEFSGFSDRIVPTHCSST